MTIIGLPLTPEAIVAHAWWDTAPGELYDALVAELGTRHAHALWDAACRLAELAAAQVPLGIGAADTERRDAAWRDDDLGLGSRVEAFALGVVFGAGLVSVFFALLLASERVG